jgi:hypothetical protein
MPAGHQSWFRGRDAWRAPRRGGLLLVVPVSVHAFVVPVPLDRLVRLLGVDGQYPSGRCPAPSKTIRPRRLVRVELMLWLLELGWAGARKPAGCCGCWSWAGLVHGSRPEPVAGGSLTSCSGLGAVHGLLGLTTCSEVRGFWAWSCARSACFSAWELARRVSVTT